MGVVLYAPHFYSRAETIRKETACSGNTKQKWNLTNWENRTEIENARCLYGDYYLSESWVDYKKCVAAHFSLPLVHYIYYRRPCSDSYHISQYSLKCFQMHASALCASIVAPHYTVMLPFPQYLWLSWKVPLLKAQCLPLLRSSIFAETPTNDQRRCVIKSIMSGTQESPLLHTSILPSLVYVHSFNHYIGSQNTWATCSHLYPAECMETLTCIAVHFAVCTISYIWSSGELWLLVLK